MNAAIVVVDLGFGDAGKGSVVDALVRRHAAHLVVRFNGGPQAAHHVVLPDGRWHCFSQWGSGTLAGARTYLSHFVYVDPVALLAEATVLAEKVEMPWDLLSVDARCPLITPFHRAANRIRERARGAQAHGTCGIGFGEAVRLIEVERRDGPLVRDLHGPGLALTLGDLQVALRASVGSLRAVTEDMRDEWRWLDDPGRILWLLSRYKSIAPHLEVVSEMPSVEGAVVFEGAQGVLLDQDWGFHPHTTWSRTTAANALALLRKRSHAGMPVEVLGVTRAFGTRHGAGPFPAAFGPTEALPLLVGEHNCDAGWQGEFRVGPLDVPLLRYATDVCPVDGLAVTCADRMVGWDMTYVSAHSGDGATLARLTPGHLHEVRDEALTAALTTSRPHLEAVPTTEWPKHLAAMLGVPLRMVSFGPACGQKCWL